MKNLPVVAAIIFLTVGSVLIWNKEKEQGCIDAGYAYLWNHFQNDVDFYLSHFNRQLNTCLLKYSVGISGGKEDAIVDTLKDEVLIYTRIKTNGQHMDGLTAEEFGVQASTLMNQ